MRKTFLFFILVSFLGIVFCIDNGIGEQKVENNHLSVYYFRGNFRCFTCYKIEQYAKEVIETNFKENLASGKMVFKTINVEEKGKEHFIDDYQLYTKSLIISLVKDGKEIKYKNLTKVWEYIRNKQMFFDYVKNEVTSYLKEL
jgi:hypothetical protein